MFILTTTHQPGEARSLPFFLAHRPGRSGPQGSRRPGNDSGKSKKKSRGIKKIQRSDVIPIGAEKRSGAV